MAVLRRRSTEGAEAIAGYDVDEPALRLIGALLVDQNETWQERRYPDMDVFAEWAAARAAAGNGNNVVAIAS